MRYSYQCEVCGGEVIDTEFRRIGDTHSHTCPECGGLLRRAVCFVFNRGMREHWNPTLGRHVTNERDFKDGLKIASESASLTTGMDHDIQPVDLRDADALGVTDEGLEHTHKVRRDTGVDPAPTTKHIFLN